MKNFLFLLLIVSCTNKQEVVDRSDPSIELRQNSTKQFIEKYSKCAVEVMDSVGYSASLVMASAIYYSRSGTSVLATRENNLFNLKCDSVNCVKNHCTRYNDDIHNEKFYKFNTKEESFKMYGKYITHLVLVKDKMVWNKKTKKILEGIIATYELDKLDTL